MGGFDRLAVEPDSGRKSSRGRFIVNSDNAASTQAFDREVKGTRRDKMGFATPQKIWLQETATDWFRRAVAEALEAAPDFFYPDRVTKMLDGMIAGRVKFSFAPWRILCMGKWLNMNVHGGARSFSRQFPATIM